VHLTPDGTFPPAHGRTFTSFASDIDLTNVAAASSEAPPPKNPCVGVLIQFGEAGEVAEFITLGGQTVTITAVAAEHVYIRAAFKTITDSTDAAAVTVFWS
jgi:hypothetical protein